MHPALSVIFFTVTAGSGYGLLILLAFARPAGLLPDISPDQIVFTGVFGLVLVTAGLLSSTLHLANPRNAWRSFTRFRTSWLSREAVFAVAFYPLVCTAMIYASLKTIRQWNSQIHLLQGHRCASWPHHELRLKLHSGEHAAA